MKPLISLSILIATAIPAAAADMSEASPDSGRSTTAPLLWSGPYFGIDGGYGWGSTSHSFSAAPSGLTPPTGTSEPKGALGGVYGGYNFQNGRFVSGIEADVDAAGLRGAYSNPSGITSTGSSRLEWDASLRARFGATFGPSLPYVTGGVAFGGYEFSGGPLPAGGPCCGGYSATLTGWTVGGGWDYAFTPHLVGRIEYRYTDYGTVSRGIPPPFPSVNMTTNNTASVVRVGLSYKY
jgi:outer membrane immunogenic protein